MSDLVVERTASIRATPEQVLPHLVDFRRWKAWSPWEGLDPDLHRHYEGPPAGVGTRYSWSGNRKAGAGSMRITEVDDSSAPQQVVVDLRFDKPFKAHNTTRFLLRPVAGGTEVLWRMTGPRTLATRIFGLMFNLDKMLGKDFEKGLAQLAATVEQEHPAR